MEPRIDVIATSVSGSISDWKKVDQIVPLFAAHGLENTVVHRVDSHHAARAMAREVLEAGGRYPISAGGSGTFRSVLEGCLDSGVPLSTIRLGFLRKGSADLIGKALGIPDEIASAAQVFADAVVSDRVVPCDVLSAQDLEAGETPWHFVGYGGAGLFGRIPYFTENRLMKWYKGLLGQFFGDLGPFTVGMTLAVLEQLLRQSFRPLLPWSIRIDGRTAATARYRALILVNGHLGPDLPFSGDRLGSGRFQLFGFRDRGWLGLVEQARRARSGEILADPARWGLERFDVRDRLELESLPPRSFPANVDGSTLRCSRGLEVRRCGQVQLLAGPAASKGAQSSGERPAETMAT